MRFNQIHLTRYGCFTDHIIDLGEDSSQDFHIVYGPNEAGKSTLRDACLDFLYGIPTRSKYNFLHDYTVMEIGALITAGENSYEGKRIKGQKNTLIGLGDAPLSETVLKTILGGVSRKDYEHMYSLNDASLEAGGESILSSEGDLGALLFGAMSGLSDISTALTKSREQTEGFFKTSGRAYYLNELKTELKRIDQEIKDNDVEASAYKRLKNDAKQAQAQWETKKKERDEKRAESRRLQGLIESYPIWQDYITIQENLASLRDAPDIPDGWADEVKDLIQKNTEARSKTETETQAVERAQAELDAIACDETGRSLIEQVNRLQGDDLEARYKTSNDIEKRRAERDRLQESIADKLLRLAQPVDTDAKTLILPAARVGELKSLMAEISTIEAGLKSTTREYEDAKRETQGAQQELEAYQTPKDDPAPIKSALEPAKDAPKPGDMKTTEDSVHKARAERDSAIATLTPWKGDAAALSVLTFPSPDFIQKLESRGEKLSEEGQRLKTEKNQLSDNLTKNISIINTLIQNAKVISDEDAAHARQKRNDTWESHRDSLNKKPLPPAENLQQSADKFFAVLAADDQLVSNRFSQSTEIAQLRKAQLDRAEIEAKLTRLEEKQQEHDAENQAYSDELEKLFSELNLPADFELSKLKVWLERCKQALKADEHLKAAEANYQSQKDKYNTARAELEKAMRSCGLTVEKLDWPQLLQLGQETLNTWAQAQQRKTVLEETLSKAKKAEEKRKQELAQAQASKARWSTAWSSCLTDTWLDEQTPVAVTEILNILESLTEDIKEAGRLDDRIKAMTDDRERYCAEVQNLARQAGETFKKDDPLSTADRLRQRVSDAEDAYKAKQKAALTLKDAEERLVIAKQAGQQISRRFEEFCKTIPADSLEDLSSQIEQGLERCRLQKRSAELESDIIRHLNQNSIKESLSILNEKVGTPESLDDVKTQHEALEQDLVDIDQQVSELYASWQKSDHELSTIGSDSTVAELLEQRESVLLEIEAAAHHFMRLSTGIMLANEALRTYRETHRSSMMKASSDAFSRMTRGAFKGLDAMPQDDRELLFGVRADGSTILASEMSRGTRYQLYLALRIAGHAELARNGETLPFFADDILEPFDDDRSKETFSLLNEMAKHGQVVYLTHHQHLCTLAQKITGGTVKIHELPDRAVPSDTPAVA
jgi:uncharacterized protein YhaN